MMFVDKGTDARTLESIYETMPDSQRDNAMKAGLFDLIKSRKWNPNLHPEIVPVHGKTGTYPATRLKRNEADSTKSGARRKGTRKGRKPKQNNQDRSKRPAKRKASTEVEYSAGQTKRLIVALSPILGYSDEYHNIVSGRRDKLGFKRNADIVSHNAKGTIRDDPRMRNIWKAKKITHRESISARSRACNLNHTGRSRKRDNCVNCALAYEARSRLIAVRAGKRIRKGDAGYVGIDHCFKGNPEMLQIEPKTFAERKRDIEEWMAEWGDGARAFVMIKYNDTQSKDAHVFVAEQLGGKTYFMEPQDITLKANPPSISYYFEQSQCMLIMRVDNLEFSPYAKYRLEHEDGRPIA